MDLSLLFCFNSVSFSPPLSLSLSLSHIYIYIYIYTYKHTHTQGSLYAWRNFSSSPREKTEPSSYHYISANRFRGTSSTFAPNHCFRFLSVGTRKTLAYSSQTENGKKLRQRIIDACQSIRNCPGTLEGVRQFMIRRVSMCASIQVQHILSICCGSTDDKDLLPLIIHRNTEVSECLIR